MIEKLKAALATLEKYKTGVSILNDGPDKSDEDHAHSLLVESMHLTGPAITDLRSAIAEMEAGEPVAWRYTFKTKVVRLEQRRLDFYHWEDTDWLKGEPLFTHPQPKAEPVQEPVKLWLWKNFVNGVPEYWAFDNAFPVGVDHSDPLTLGDPCGYALLKESRKGRNDIADNEVLRRVVAAEPQAKLWDSQWVNIVNDPVVQHWETSKEDAVHRAVKLTEEAMMKNASAPQAKPLTHPKCVKCGDELMSSFTNTCYACKQKADRAPCRITTDGVCEAMECFEDEQPKKPLSVLQIRDIRDTFDKDEPISLVAFARAIEAAHGIK